jgi:TctA family transporter
MFLADVIGYGLHRNGYPFVPLVLGTILGSLADENLRRAVMVNEGQYLEMQMRPIGIALLLAVIWSFYYGIRRANRTMRPTNPPILMATTDDKAKTSVQDSGLTAAPVQ